MDETTRAVMLGSLLGRWAEMTRRQCSFPEGMDDRRLLEHCWVTNAALRERCGWSKPLSRPWTEEDTYRVRVELSRLRLDLEGEYAPATDEDDDPVDRPARVAAGACRLTGVLLGWPDGAFDSPPLIEVWNLIGESMEVLNRANARCTPRRDAEKELMDHAEPWEFSLGPGA